MKHLLVHWWFTLITIQHLLVKFDCPKNSNCVQFLFLGQPQVVAELRWIRKEAKRSPSKLE